MPSTQHHWTREEVQRIYNQPLLELVFQAAQVHRQYHTANEVQVCTLLSIKDGRLSGRLCLLSAGRPISHWC